MRKKKSTEVYLSACLLHPDVQVVIDWCLDRGYDTIVNDYTMNYIEYSLSDLYQVWDRLYNAISRLIEEITN